MEEIILQSTTMERVIERAMGFALFNDLYEVIEVQPNAIVLRCIVDIYLIRIEAVGPMSEHLRDPGSTGAASMKSQLPRLLRF